MRFYLAGNIYNNEEGITFETKPIQPSLITSPVPYLEQSLRYKLLSEDKVQISFNNREYILSLEDRNLQLHYGEYTIDIYLNTINE
jgi:hypothetical protein